MRKEFLCYSSTGRCTLVLRLGCVSVVEASEFLPSPCSARQIGSFRAVLWLFLVLLLPCYHFFHSPFYFFFVLFSQLHLCGAGLAAAGS